MLDNEKCKGSIYHVETGEKVGRGQVQAAFLFDRLGRESLTEASSMKAVRKKARRILQEIQRGSRAGLLEE